MLVLTSKENINLSWHILVEFGLLNIIYLFHINVDTVLRMGGLKLWRTRWTSGEGSRAKAPPAEGHHSSPRGRPHMSPESRETPV